jgi:ABC-type multidrug transport system fused ATPase/permease subunit
MASSERVFTLLDMQPEVKPPRKPVSFDSIKGYIEFREVSFSYDKINPVLKNISFKAEPGETVAVAGRTGAGKTTIINLLCRFYDPDQGEILIDGKNIRDLDLTELRKNIGLVQQDLFLFTGTLEENICLDQMRTDGKKAESFAEVVKAGRFIQAMPEGYNTKISERGATLSTGQRQLLSFARALTVDPKILILDEATSSVDTETEGYIQEALKIILQGRTSIVIAHRLSTVRQADKIIVLHKGEIRETGNHEELLAKEGIYYKLYKLQTSVFDNMGINE